MAFSSSNSKIEVSNLFKNFGDNHVVNDLSLSLSSGEIVGLLGPNGAGKTTTFYIILGLMKATQGSVYMSGKNITDLAMYQRARLGIGYLPQDSSIFRKLSVYNNLRAIAETLPISKNKQLDKVGSLLSDFGLEEKKNQIALTLSGGERRRLEIARCVLPEPKFLFMDEPFSGVDPINVAEVQDIVLRLKKQNMGVFITDHNVRETLKIVDRAYLLYKGSILSEGNSDYLLNDPKSREFYLGDNFKIT